MKLERTAACYVIQVDPEDFQVLMRVEHNWPLRPQLAEALGAIKGLRDVESDGRYGPCIHFTIEAEQDVPSTHKSICDLIEKFLKRARKTPPKSPDGKVVVDGFFLGPDDVIAAAESLGYDIDRHAASQMLKETSDTELAAICIAAVESSDDAAERTFIARGRIADCIASGCMDPPRSLKH